MQAQHPQQQHPQQQCSQQQSQQNATVAKGSYLHQQGWTSGLINVVLRESGRFPLRFWIMDNSSSMQTRDAHIVGGSTVMGLHRAECTRWQEAQQAMIGFSHMAATLQLPTRFSMLNDLGSMFGPQHFSIGEHGPQRIAEDLRQAQSTIMRAYPSGATPLTQHLAGIRNAVLQMSASVAASGRLIPIIISTDGIPSDNNGNEGHMISEQFRSMLSSFAGLPVWIIIRLCTDNEDVFDFYHSLNLKLKIYIDVLDDYFGEALEVYLQNPWLTYALPLHRLREIGFYVPPLDELDDHLLSYNQLRRLFAVIFEHGRMLPDPQQDWVGFLRGTAQLMSREQHYFNPVLRTRTPLIDLRRLHLLYGHGIPFPPDLRNSSQFPVAPPTPTRSLNNKIYRRASSESSSSWHHSSSTSRPPPANNGGTAAPAPQAAYTPSANGSNNTTNGGPASPSDHSALKYNIIRWAVTPASQLRPIDQLLSCMQQTFPPSFGVPNHSYFQQWHPIAHDTLKDRRQVVIKRAYRKAKVFLHPDKLPKDLSSQQLFLCKMLWDILADSWEIFESS